MPGLVARVVMLLARLHLRPHHGLALLVLLDGGLGLGSGWRRRGGRVRRVIMFLGEDLDLAGRQGAGGA